MNETHYDRDFPFSMAFLSDTHNTDPAPILNSLQRNRPEIIVITGDFVRGEISAHSPSKMAESRNASDLFRGCSDIAPTYVSMGNHERSLNLGDLKLIPQTGVVILDNTWIEYKGVFIGGLSSAYFTEYKKFRAEGRKIGSLQSHIPNVLRYVPVPDTSWLKDFCALPGKKILLCHHPEYYQRYLLDLDIDLILSGHCHGGQWRYYSLIKKEWRGVYGPGQGLFPAFTAGIYDGRLAVSRGLSNTTFVPRINNPTEIIYFN